MKYTSLLITTIYFCLSGQNVFAEYDWKARQILKENVKLHLEAIYQDEEYLKRWEYPKIVYLTHMYDSPENDFRPSPKLDKEIDQIFQELSQLVNIKFRRVYKKPENGDGYMILNFTNNFYETATNDPNIKRLFFYSRENIKPYLDKVVKNRSLDIGVRYRSKEKVAFYLYLRDLKSIRQLFEPLFFSMTMSNESNVIVPSIFNNNDQYWHTGMHPVDKIYIQSLYRLPFYHGMPIKIAVSLLTDMITKKLVNEDIHVNYRN